MIAVRKSENHRVILRSAQKDSDLINLPVEINREELTETELFEDKSKDEEIVCSQEVCSADGNEEHELIEFVEPNEEWCMEENLVEEPVRKKLRPATSNVCIPESIVFTHYKLEQDNDEQEEQPVIVLTVTPALQHIPKDGVYKFDTAWMKHENARANSIFKCKYCVKAFSNADFLLKHTISCHLCLICLKTMENYKELFTHSQQHRRITCHFCDEHFTNIFSSSKFRQHLKKQHSLKIPNHIGIIPETFLAK